MPQQRVYRSGRISGLSLARRNDRRMDSNRLRLAAGVSAVAMAVGSIDLRADDIHWNAGTELYFDSLNWWPDQVPVFGDNAFINNGGTATTYNFGPVTNDNFWIGLNGGEGHFDGQDSNVWVKQYMGVGFIDRDHVDPTVTTHSKGTFSLVGDSERLGDGTLKVGKVPDSELYVGTAFGDGKAEGWLDLLGTLRANHVWVGSVDSFDRDATGKGWMNLTNKEGVFADDEAIIQGDLIIGSAWLEKRFMDRASAKAHGKVEIRELVDTSVGQDVFVGMGFLFNQFTNEDGPVDAWGELFLQRDISFNIGSQLYVGVADGWDGGAGTVYGGGNVIVDGANSLTIGNGLQIGVSQAGDFAEAKSNGYMSLESVDSFLLGGPFQIGVARTREDGFGQAWANGKFEWQRLGNINADLTTFYIGFADSRGEGTSKADADGEFYLDEVSGNIVVSNDMKVGVSFATESSTSDAYGRARIDELNNLSVVGNVYVGSAKLFAVNNLVMPTAVADGWLHLERMGSFSVVGTLHVGKANARDGGSGDATAKAEVTIQDVAGVNLGGITVADVAAGMRGTATSVAKLTFQDTDSIIIGLQGIRVGTTQVNEFDQAIADGSLYINNNDAGISSAGSLFVAVVAGFEDGNATTTGKFLLNGVSNGIVGFSGPGLIGTADADDTSTYSANGLAKLENIDGTVFFGLTTLSPGNNALEVGTIDGDEAASGSVVGVMEIRNLDNVVRLLGSVEVGEANLDSSAIGTANGTFILENVFDAADSPFALQIDGGLQVGDVDAEELAQGTVTGLFKVHNNDGGVFIDGLVEVGKSDTTEFASGQATGELSFRNLNGSVQFGTDGGNAGPLHLGWASANGASTATGTGKLYAGEIAGVFDIWGDVQAGFSFADGSSTATANGEMYVGQTGDRLTIDGALHVGVANTFDNGIATGTGKFDAMSLGGTFTVDGIVQVGYANAASHGASTGTGTFNVSDVSGNLDLNAAMDLGVASSSLTAQTTAIGTASIDRIGGFFSIDFNTRIGAAFAANNSSAWATGDLQATDITTSTSFGSLEIGLALSAGSSQASASGNFSVDGTGGVFLVDGETHVGRAHAESLSQSNAAGVFNLNNVAIDDVLFQAPLMIGDSVALGSGQATVAGDASIRNVGAGGLAIAGQLVVGRAVSSETGTAMATGADMQTGSTFIVESVDGEFMVGSPGQAALQLTVGLAHANNNSNATAAATASITDVLTAQIVTQNLLIGTAESLDQGTATTKANFTLETVGSSIAVDGNFNIGLATATMLDPVVSPGHATSTTTTNAVIDGVDDITVTQEMNVGVARTSGVVLTDGPVARSTTALKLIRADNVEIDLNLNIAVASAEAPSGLATANGIEGTPVEFADIASSLLINENLNIAHNVALGDSSASSVASVIMRDIADVHVGSSVFVSSIQTAQDTADASADVTLELRNINNMQIDQALVIGTTDLINDSATAAAVAEVTILNTAISIDGDLHIGRTHVEDGAMATTDAVVDVFDSTLVVSNNVIVGRLEGGSTNSANSADGTLALHNSQLIVGGVTMVATDDGLTQGTVSGSLTMNPSHLSTPALILGENAHLRMELDGLLRGVEYSAIDALAGVDVAQIDGELEIVFTFVPDLPGTYDFDLISTNNADGIEGLFDNVILANFPEGFSFFFGTTLNDLGNEVWRLRISEGDPTFTVSTPEPGALLGIAGLAGLGLARRRRDAA